MKHITLPTLIAALIVGGIAGAAAGTLSADEAAPQEAKDSGGRGMDSQLAQQVSALREENRDLRERVDALEKRPAAVATQSFSDKTARDEIASFKETVEQLRTNPMLQGPEVIAQKIEEVQEQREAAAAQRRAREEMLRAQAQAGRHADNVAKKLSLSSRQSEQLQTALELTFTTNSPLWKSARDDAVPAKQRLEAAVLLQQSLTLFHQTLPGFLSPAEVEQYHGVGDRQTHPAALSYVNGLIETLHKLP